MEFVINRASSLSHSEKPPCDEAYKKQRFHQNGEIDIDGKWSVEINSLEELLALVNKYGRILVEDYIPQDGVYSILIADDYLD